MPVEVGILDFIPAKVKELRESGGREDGEEENIFINPTEHNTRSIMIKDSCNLPNFLY